MAIVFTRYVSITSGVGAGSSVSARSLNGRLFTTNPLVPTSSFVTFNTLAEVGSYFGTSSDEYARAEFYFGWISKNITTPDSIDFARWTDAASPPRIYGNKGGQLLSTYTSISAGSFGLTIGGVANTFTGLDFTGAGSLAAVAAIIETAVQAKVGTQWTAANVSYNATRGSFDFEGGSAVDAAISVQQGVGGTPIAGLLGWLSGSTLILSDGQAAQSITDTLTDSANASDNFGSFLFMPSLTIDEITEAATWNDEQNVKYIFCVPAADSDIADDIFVAVGDLAGTAVTYAPLATEYPEQVPMMIEAATDYDAVNSVQNYMFQMFSLTPSVTTDEDADYFDARRVNYYGRTQSAGQFIDFYQRGYLMGEATDPQAMNVYANEIWLKDAAGSQIMTLLLSLSKLSANAQGRSQLLCILQAVVNRALNNGTISVGKNLTEVQKLYVTQVTGDANAWYQVQTIGYWLDAVIESYVNSESQLTEYRAIYTLVYSKDDVINKVVGRHVLI